MTKFVAVKFKPEDSRTYTYSWDGPDLFPGDRVKVADNRDPSAWKRVTVVSVSDEAPPFACKPILGRVEDVPTEPQPEAERPGAYHAGMLDDDLDGDVVQF